MSLPAFVDLHSHVVPSGDDGATSVEEGLELCRIAFEAGTRVLFVTPHVHAEWDSYPWTPARARIFEQAFPVMEAAVAEWGLDLRRGREVFPTEVATHDSADLRLEGTTAVLVELPGWWLDYPDPIPLITQAGELIEAEGLVPVLAHPERCRAIGEEPELMRPLAERGWPLCVNAPSLLGTHGEACEQAAWHLVEEGLVAFAASDAHRATRSPALDAAFRATEARIGRERALPLFDGRAVPWDGGTRAATATL